MKCARDIQEPQPIITDVAAFKTSVQSVITTNPFAGEASMTAGDNHAAVREKQGSVHGESRLPDADENGVGNLSDKFSTLAGFDAGAEAIFRMLTLQR